MSDENIERECPECGALCLVDDGNYVAIESIPVSSTPDVPPIALAGEPTFGMDRSQFHDKAWALYHSKALDDAKLPKLSIYTIRMIWNALYDSMPVSTAPSAVNSDQTCGELLSCPFCFGTAHFFAIDEQESSDFGGQGVVCTDCGASVGLKFACGEDPKPGLAEAWNRRSTAPIALAGEPVAIYQRRMTNPRGEGWIDTSKLGYDAALKSSIFEARIVYAAPTPRAQVEGNEQMAYGTRINFLESELAAATRMFNDACHDLGLINEALGLDPDDGGTDPILDAIAELKGTTPTPIPDQAAGEPLGYVSAQSINFLRQNSTAVISPKGMRDEDEDIAVYLAAPTPSASSVPVADYEEVMADHRRLVRELDFLLNGEEGAAKQASLCDIVQQVRTHHIKATPIMFGFKPLYEVPARADTSAPAASMLPTITAEMVEAAYGPFLSVTSDMVRRDSLVEVFRIAASMGGEPK